LLIDLIFKGKTSGNSGETGALTVNSFNLIHRFLDVYGQVFSGKIFSGTVLEILGFQRAFCLVDKKIVQAEVGF